MSKFYCNICGEDVTLQDGKCPKCKTNWKKVIEKEEKSDNQKPFKTIKKIFFEDDENIEDDESNVDRQVITQDDILDNIDFFLKWSEVVLIVFIIIAIIIAVVAFGLIGITRGLSLLLLIPTAVTIIIAIIASNCLKWKAYMLHTNYKRK